MITLIEEKKPKKIEMDYISGYITADNKKFVEHLFEKRKKEGKDKSISNTVNFIILNFKKLYQN